MDLNILLWIQKHLQTGWMSSVMRFISALGENGFVWILLFFALLLFRKTRRNGAVVGVSLFLMLLLGNILIKNIVARPRPFQVYDSVQLLIAPPSGYSFPSGHTASSFAAVFALMFAGSRLWKWMLPLAVLIAFSRLYLFVHFPTDILGGIALGLLCGWLGALIVRLATNGAIKSRARA